MRQIAAHVGANGGASDGANGGAIVGAIVAPNVWGRGKPGEPFFSPTHTSVHNTHFAAQRASLRTHTLHRMGYKMTANEQQKHRDGLPAALGITAALAVVGVGGATYLATNWPRIARLPVGNVGGAVLVAGGSLIGLKVAGAVWDGVANRLQTFQDRALTLREKRIRTRYTHMQTDRSGRLGVIIDADGRLHDLDTGRMVDLERQITIALDPVMEQLRWINNNLQAKALGPVPNHYHNEHIVGDNQLPAARQAELEAGDKQSTALRDRVTLEDLTQRYGPGSYGRLLLGETVDQETNQYRPVYGNMQEMVHILVSGGTGYGKSTLAEAMAKQLVLSRDADLAFCDLGCNTFGQFTGHSLYPIADTSEMIQALFQALYRELQRRYELFKEYPRVKNLRQFNQTTGEQLRPVVTFVDEASVLFDGDIGVQRLATDLARQGRKVGLDFVFAGTDFNADVFPTSARSNFGARVAFHFDEPTLSRSIIRSTNAVNLKERGRALAALPGQPLTELQAPIVESWDDLPPVREVIELAPAGSMVKQEQGVDPSQVAQIRDLRQAGKSLNAIQQEVFGYTGGAAYTAVKTALDDSTTTTQADDPGENNQVDSAGGSSSTTIDWCEYCQDTRSDDPHKRFFACQGCGVAVCSECAPYGRCAECEEAE